MNNVFLPDDAIVVRGGKGSFRQIQLSLQFIPEYGFALAVISAPEKSFEELCKVVPHRFVRCTTVGLIRKVGGDVISVEGHSPYHAVVIGIEHSTSNETTAIAAQFGGNPLEVSQADPLPSSTMRPVIFADFNNADSAGRVRLNTIGSIEDVRRQAIALVSDMEVELYDCGDIVVGGSICFDNDEQWAAKVDWSRIY